VSSVVPVADLVEFQRLPASVRGEVDRWSAALRTVRKPIQESLAKVAQSMGVSVQTARRKYDAQRKEGWRGLVDDRKAPAARGLSPELIDHWKALCERNQRKCKPAYRELVRQFFAGEPIPGIEPGTDRSALPPGMSYDNLMRHQPSQYELAVARIGRSAGAAHRPLVYTTRAGMQVGQQYLFDDIWHDFKVSVLGQRGARRLLQLHSTDVFSGCQFARACKPRIDDAEGKSIGLKEDEMMFLVLHVLASIGYHPDGCALQFKH
jgi:hypothetical protein